MDETLRRAARDQDPLELAAALRRAGRAWHAWRLLADAWDEDPRARAALDEWFPLQPGLLDLMVPPSPEREYAERQAREEAVWQQLAKGDPRVEPRLGELLRAELARCEQLGATWAARTAMDQLALLEEPRGFRRALKALELKKSGLSMLARVQLLSDEVLPLLVASRGRAQDDPVLLLVAWLAGRDGDERAATALSALRGSDWLLALEVACALERLRLPEAPPRVPARPELPPRPAWHVWERFERDWLTRCLDRGGLGEALPEGGAVILLDLDWLTKVNHVHGPYVGDALLVAVGRALMAEVGDRITRWAGDEFVVVWERPDPESVARALLRAVAAVRVEGDARPADGSASPPAGTTCSIGVARGGSLAEAIRRAGEAMRSAKEKGRNRVEVDA